MRKIQLQRDRWSSPYNHSFEFRKNVTERIVKVEIKADKLEEQDLNELGISHDGIHKEFHTFNKRGIKVENNCLVIDSSLFMLGNPNSYNNPTNEVKFYITTSSVAEKLTNVECEVTLDYFLGPFKAIKRYSSLRRDCLDKKLYFKFYSKEDYEKITSLSIYDVDAKIKMYDKNGELVDITEENFTKCGDHLLLNKEYIDLLEKVDCIKVYLKEDFVEDFDYFEYELTSSVKIPKMYID